MIEALVGHFSSSELLVGLARTAALMALGFVLLLVLLPMLDRRVRRTRSAYDDVIVATLKLPLHFLVVVMGTLEFAVVLLEQADVSWALRLRTAQGIGVMVFMFWMALRFVYQMETVMVRAAKERAATSAEPLKFDAAAIQGGSRVIRATVLVVGALTVMSSLGVSIGGILAFGGVGGIVIGLAAQDLLSNYFSGMMIFWDRPFHVGDWVRIESANIEGVVEAIGWRVTQIRTFDQRPLYVPNRILSANVIENPQRMTNRRIYEYLGVRYDDIRALPAIIADIREMLENSPEIDTDRTLIVNFDRYGPSSLDFFVYAMTRTTDWIRFHEVKQDVLLGIARIVERHGAEFAFPTRTVHHRDLPDLRGPAPEAPGPAAGA